MSEAGVKGYDVSTWFGLLAPAGTPTETIRILDQTTQRLLALPQNRERLRLMGAEPADEGPEAFAALVRSDSAKWGEVVRKGNIRAD